MAIKMSGEDIFLTKNIYDMAVEAGSRLKSANVRKEQVQHLLELYEKYGDKVEALKILILFIGRQSGRNYIVKDAASVIVRHIQDISNRYSNDIDSLDTAMHKYLTVMKWVYESVGRERLRNFNDYMSHLLR